MSPSTLPPKAKRLRAGKPKSRNGCSTCKTRRVKCDEGKPICGRCQNFEIGHGCVYPREENLRSKKLSLLHPRPESLHPANDTLHFSTRLPQLSARDPSASVPGDEEERRYFELFREKVAHIICGYFETPFWTRLIPQMCHHEPAIRHEIVALSALFKSSMHEEDEQSGKDNHRKLAILYQSKALSYLRKSLSGDSKHVRLALITSLLFGCFEIKYGNWQTATHQIYTAKKLLKEWRTDRNSNSFTVTNYTQMPPAIDLEIPPALGRLEMHLMSLLFMNPVYSPPFAEDYDGVNECFANMPNRFTSLEIAHPYAFQIAILALKAHSKSVRYNTRIMFSHFPTVLKREQTKLREDFELWGKVIARWYAAFGPLFHDQDIEVTTQENLGILQCYVSVLAFDTILSTSMETEECVFDKFLGRFRYIISSSRFLFQMDQDFRLLGLPMLYFGTGLIMFLFYAATRCRDSKLRREAIAILRKYPFRNGVWDSLVSAEIANWVADLEDEGRDKDGLVPERARVRMHTLKATMDGGVVNAECLQGVVGDGLKSRRATLSLRPLVFVHSELGKKL